MNSPPLTIGEPMKKYGEDAPFEDPVVRCDSCGKIILMKTIHQYGFCKCGNRKVRGVTAFNLREYLKMRFWWRVDPEYLKTFNR